MPRSPLSILTVLIVSLLPLLGCTTESEKCTAKQAYLENEWAFRATLIYDHPKLTRLQKINRIHALGAACEIDPNTVQADLEQELDRAR